MTRSHILRNLVDQRERIYSHVVLQQQPQLEEYHEGKVLERRLETRHPLLLLHNRLKTKSLCVFTFRLLLCIVVLFSIFCDAKYWYLCLLFCYITSTALLHSVKILVIISVWNMKYSLYLVFLIVSSSYNAKQMYGVHLNNRLTEVQSCTSSNSLSSILYLILYLMKLRRCNVCYTCCMMLCNVANIWIFISAFG